MVKNVGLYVRVSTREQAESGWSVEGQLKELREFCDNQKEWKVRWLLKDPGYSAKDLNRPGIQRLLELCQKGILNTLVVWKFDRLSRDNLDFTALLHIMHKAGVEVVSVQEPSLDYGSPHGEFIIGMLGLVSTLERRTIQVRVKMGMKTRAEKGLWHGGPVPFGYRYNKETGRLAIHETESAAVKAMFSLFMEHQNLYGVKAEIKRRGHRKRSGAVFTVPDIRAVLRRERYLGNVESFGVRVVDPELAIIAEEKYNNVQAILDEEKITGELADELDTEVKHYFPGKKENPACPECGRKQTVRKKGVDPNHVGGRRYYCRGCNRYFTSTTAEKGLPYCLKCRSKEGMRRFYNHKKGHFSKCMNC